MEVMIPAITDFRARGTIMGPAGLTAVFGMGTGVAPPVWSPGKARAGGEAGAGRRCDVVRQSSRSGFGGASVASTPHLGPDGRAGIVVIRSRGWLLPGPGRHGGWRRAGRGGQAARLLGPVGCDPRGSCTPGLSTWWSPRSLQYLVHGNLVSEGASRLDAFSAYPVPTWLPCDAPSGTAGTPAVGPPQSSRTRGDAPQVSCAHGR